MGLKVRPVALQGPRTFLGTYLFLDNLILILKTLISLFHYIISKFVSRNFLNLIIKYFISKIARVLENSSAKNGVHIQMTTNYLLVWLTKYLAMDQIKNNHLTLDFWNYPKGKDIRGGNLGTEILSDLPKVLQLPCGRAFLASGPSSKASSPPHGTAWHSTALPSPTDRNLTQPFQISLILILHILELRSF